MDIEPMRTIESSASHESDDDGNPDAAVMFGGLDEATAAAAVNDGHPRAAASDGITRGWQLQHEPAEQDRYSPNGRDRSSAMVWSPMKAVTTGDGDASSSIAWGRGKRTPKKRRAFDFEDPEEKKGEDDEEDLDVNEEDSSSEESRADDTTTITRKLPTPLTTSQDTAHLSPLSCFIRSTCLEYFAAPFSKVTPGRKAAIVEGRIGVRCVFCKHIPKIQRASQSESFPSRVEKVYSSVMMIQCRHLPKCNMIPSGVRKKMNNMGNVRPNYTAYRGNYWEDSANEIGLVNTDAGVMASLPCSAERSEEVNEHHVPKKRRGRPSKKKAANNKAATVASIPTARSASNPRRSTKVRGSTSTTGKCLSEPSHSAGAPASASRRYRLEPTSSPKLLETLTKEDVSGKKRVREDAEESDDEEYESPRRTSIAQSKAAAVTDSPRGRNKTLCEEIASKNPRLCQVIDCQMYAQGGAGGYCIAHYRNMEEENANKPAHICFYLGCNMSKKQDMDGYCSQHFKLIQGAPLPQSSKCLFPGCSDYRRSGCKGHCASHFDWGRSVDDKATPKPKNRLCRIKGCTKYKRFGCDDCCKAHFNGMAPQKTRVESESDDDWGRCRDVDPSPVTQAHTSAEGKRSGRTRVSNPKYADYVHSDAEESSKEKEDRSEEEEGSASGSVAIVHNHQAKDASAVSKTALLERTRQELLNGNDCWICTDCCVTVPSLATPCGSCKKSISFVPLEHREFEEFVRLQRQLMNPQWMVDGFARSGLNRSSSNGFVLPDNPNMISDFRYFLFEQLSVCYKGKGRYKDTVHYKSKGVFDGFPGLGCKHCAGTDEHKRWFPATPKSLIATTFTRHILKHLKICQCIPADIQMKILEMEEEDDAEKAVAGWRVCYVALVNCTVSFAV